MADRKPIFMVHKHQATRLHYDFRFEISGNLKSWALRALPVSPDKSVLAIRVPDHPFWYRHFEGVIAPFHYGAGPVMVWDKGLYTIFTCDHLGKKLTPEEALEQGILLLWLEGHKLRGGFMLVKISKKQRWLMIKLQDQYVPLAKTKNWQRSVKSDRTLFQINQERPKL